MRSSVEGTAGGRDYREAPQHLHYLRRVAVQLAGMLAEPAQQCRLHLLVDAKVVQRLFRRDALPVSARVRGGCDRFGFVPSRRIV